MNISTTFKSLTISFVCLSLISTLVSCNQPAPTPETAARVSELEATILTLEVELADAEARVSVLETALVEAELVPTPETAARVSELEATILTLEVELADAEARVSVLETTLAGLEVVREVEKYEEPVLSFTKTFGGEEDDRAHLVQQTTDGGYIIAGSTESFGTGSLDIYVIKTDGEGNEEWSQTFGGEKDDIASSVQQTTDGGYIIAGLTMHWGNGDVYLVKTDGEGNEEWSRAFGGMEDDRAFSVQQTTDGGYIIAGDTKSYGVGGSDVYLVKTDGVGNGEWSQTFGGEDGDRAFSVQQTTDGGYIIAGGTASYGAGYTDVYLVKTDGGGNEEWYRTFGGEGYDEAFSVQQTADGGYIIAGDTESFGVGNSDAYLVKTDGEGNGEWSRTFGGEAYDTAYVGQHGGTTAQQTADGGYIIAGGTASYGAGNSDVYVIKVSITITEVVEIKIIGQ